MSTICRLCAKLNNTSELLQIFTDSSTYLQNKISCILQIQISYGDGLPASICKLCIEKLEFSSQFISGCVATDDLLHKVITFIYEVSSPDSQLHNITEETFRIFELINGNGGMASLCRICATQHDSDQSKILLCADNNSYLKKLRTVLIAKPSKEDGLPDGICVSCATKLDAAHDFITACAHEDSLLRNVFHKVTDVKDVLQLEPHSENNATKQQETLENDAGVDFADDDDAPISPLCDPLANPYRSDLPNQLCTIDDDLTTQHITDQPDMQLRQPRRKVKAPWTKEDDDKLVQLVHKFGPRKWKLMARQLQSHSAKRCRDRWHNQLDPNVKKTAWNLEEDAFVFAAHRFLGNQWSKIALMLPGHTDNAINNRLSTTLRRRSNKPIQTYRNHNVKHTIGVEKELQTTCGTSAFPTELFTSESSTTNFPRDNSEWQPIISPKQLQTSIKQRATPKMQLDAGDHSYARTDRCSVTPCNVCKVKFDSKRLLQTHMQTHAVDCNRCGKKFRCNSKLSAHMRRHANVHANECQECYKLFSSKSRLRAHATLKHSGPLPDYACDTCGKKFQCEYSVKVHKELHTRGESFACPDCDKIFHKKYYLCRHALEEHSVPLPSPVCDRCGKQFRNSYLLAVHLRRHADERAIECPECHKLLSHKSTFCTCKIKTFSSTARL